MPKMYIAGNRPDGVSDVLSEDDITTIAPLPSGIRVRDFYINRTTPADLSDNSGVSEGAVIHEPPDGGAIFRTVHFMPEGEMASVEDALRVHQNLNSAHVPDPEKLAKAKHPSMHKTDTLNYFVVVFGEMWMLTEGRDVLVKAGDVIIQKGCEHGWRNDSDKPCVLVAVLIDALPAT